MKKKALLGVIPITGVLIALSFILIPGQTKRDDDLSYYKDSGPFTVSQDLSFENNSIFYPTELGRDGMKHPIVIWGDGTGAVPLNYSVWLSHLASHGFVVIGPNDPTTRKGVTMIAAMGLIVSKNDDSNSQFYQKLDVDKICVMGHSQGASSTLLLGTFENVTCTVPMMPSYWLYYFHNGFDGTISHYGPMLLIAATEDETCPPETNSDVIFENSNVPTFYGNLIGGVHVPTIQDQEEIAKYVTAWCYLQLFEDSTVESVFYGSDASINDDTLWIWDTKNV